MLVKLVGRYRRLVAVLVTVSIIQFFELTLLYYKYDIFTGGFLQPYAYKSISERLLFVIASLWFDLTLFGTVASLWFSTTDRFNKYGLLVYYNFIAVMVLLMGVWLAFKFKVLSYFGDTINLQVMKNLAGGSLKNALLYASNEIVLFVGMLCFTGLCLFLLVNFFKRQAIVQQFAQQTSEYCSYTGLLLVVILLTPFVTFWVSNDDFIRYGLEKKTSYRLISSSLDSLSDVDFDGFGSFSYPKDKAILNANIYPGALDIPGNGIDEDGFLGDAITTAPEKDSLATITPKSGKHIILVVLETARADVLQQQINGQFVAPILRTIAQSGTAIPYAYSHTGYTVTSIEAIFNRSLLNKKEKITLIDFLQAAGYELSIISGQDESFGNVAIDTGMKNAGVHYFDARTAIDDRVFPSTESGSLRLSEERIVKQFQQQIQQVNFAKPQFFYINIQAGHFPYAYPKMTQRIIDNPIPRSEISAENKDWVAVTYWNAMANADWAVGQIIDSLKSRKVLDNVTLVILGDHGESLFEDKFLGHGHALNDTQTKIPLIINDSAITAKESIGQIDVAEIALRSALGLPNILNNSNKRVFQWVGSLAQPILIAQVQQDGIRTLFDFRSEKVFFSDTKTWKSYAETLADLVYKERLVNLIREWESLRWREYNANSVK